MNVIEGLHLILYECNIAIYNDPIETARLLKVNEELKQRAIHIDKEE